MHRYDEQTGDGAVLTDNGRVLPFTAEVFATSGLRLLRIGQRLSIEVGGEGVSRMWLTGIGAGQKIR